MDDIRAVEGIKAVDEALFDIWKRVWNLKHLKPTNLKEERERFFASNQYEPQLTYREPDFNVHEEGKRLEKLLAKLKKLPDERVKGLLEKKIGKLRSWLAMIETRGAKEFTKHSLDYYGEPSEELIRRARELLDQDEEDEAQPLTAEEAIPRFRAAVEERGLDWKVIAMKGLASRADCVIPEKTLYVRADARFSEKSIKKLIVHELGVHALRATNGEKERLNLYVMGTAEYETTEEGLAAFMEEREGVSTKRGMKRKAILVIIVHLALRQGFREVYEFVSQHLPAKSAFLLTMKVKRGLGDTSKPGAFTKDHIYLKGLEMVRRLSDEERGRLFKGRIAIEDL